MTCIQRKLENGLRRPNVAVDAFTISHLNQGVTLTFKLQNLIRSSVGASQYSPSILSKLFKPFMRYRGNDIWPDKQNNGTA